MGMGRHALQIVLLCQCLAWAAGCTSSGGDAVPPGEVADVRADPHNAPPELSETTQLSDYLAYAALHNPGLEAAFNRWKAELERVPQATALPDPRFTYRYYIERVETRVGPQRQSFEIAQTFPWFGKLALRGDVAMEAANAAKERYEAQKLKLFHEVKDAYYEYYYLGRAVEVVGKTRDLAKQFEDVARMKYRTGTAQLADVIRAQVELGKLEDRLRSLTEMQQPTVARLNAALNRSVTAALPWPKSVPEETVASTDDEILRMLQERNPELKVLDHEIARYRKAGELARKEYYPDVTLGLSYIETGSAVMPGVSDSGKDPVMVGVSVNLPIWFGKYRAGEREAARRRWAAIKEKADRTNLLSYRAKRVLFDFRDAERKISLYRDTLLPLARESLKTTEAGFAAGTSSFLDLIDTQRVMLEFELSYERALTDHAQRLAELEMLVGQDLPRGEAPPETETGEADSPDEVPAAEPAKQEEPKEEADQDRTEEEPSEP